MSKIKKYQKIKTVWLFWLFDSFNIHVWERQLEFWQSSYFKKRSVFQKIFEKWINSVGAYSTVLCLFLESFQKVIGKLQLACEQVIIKLWTVICEEVVSKLRANYFLIRNKLLLVKLFLKELLINWQNLPG